MTRLLQDAKERAEEGLESEHDLDKRVEAEVIPKLVQERGLSSLVEKMRQWQEELKGAEAELGKQGFDWHGDGVIDLEYDAPEELRLPLEKAERLARKQRDAELLKYDQAILRVWAAPSADDARRVAEQLLQP